MNPDYAAATRCTAEVASHGIDIHALAESLQRQGPRAFEADWSSLPTRSRSRPPASGSPPEMAIWRPERPAPY